MFSNIKKIFSLSFSQSIIVAANFILNIILARQLAINDYGTYSQTFLAYDIAAPLISIGLPSTIVYLFAKNEINPKSIISNSFTLLLIIAVSYSLYLNYYGIHFFSNKFSNPLLIESIKNIVLYPIFTLPILLCTPVWVTFSKYRINLLFNLFYTLILFFSIILLLNFTKNINYLIFLRVLVQFFSFPVAIILLFNTIKSKFIFPSFKIMFQILKFSIPLALATIFTSFAIQIVNLLVSNNSIPSEFAIYSIGAKEIPFISLITGSISTILISDLTTRIKSNNLEGALALFKNSSIISALFLIPLMIFLFFNAEEFIKIFYTNKYLKSVIVFKIYLFVVPIRIIYYSSTLIAFGKTKEILLRSIFDFFFIISFSYVGIKFFGIFGAALGLVLTLYIWTVPFNLYILKKKFNCKILNLLPFKELMLIISFSFVSLYLTHIIFFILFDFSLSLKFTLNFLFYFIFFIILILNTSNKSRDILISYYNKYNSK